MKRLVVLGAGTAGTALVNRLRRRLAPEEWDITVVDRDDDHHYQPEYLFVPFDVQRVEAVVRPRRRLLADGVRFVEAVVDEIRVDSHLVELAGGEKLPYDQLVIASGTHPRPDQTPGLLSPEWGQTVHTFYTLDGAVALARALEQFRGGRLVVNLVEMPVKCPPASLEFAFLVDAWLRARGQRDRVELVYATSLSGAFTKPIASRLLGDMLDERNIRLESDFYLERVDPEARMAISYDEREVPYDLLVTVPVNMGSDFVGRSGLGDELNHVMVDRGTFLAKGHEDIFAVGDAADLPTSKAGSVAHFSAEVLVENFLNHIVGVPMRERFDGHANCFVESGDGKAMLIDFNYETEPLPGTYPIPLFGPFSLLKESRINHWGKLAFKWLYWNVLLPGRRLPLPTAMSMAGKKPPTEQVEIENP
jgi:sulfide:quinone oxidoreductase